MSYYLPLVYATSVSADIAIMSDLLNEATLPSERALGESLLEDLFQQPRYCKCCRMADFAIDTWGHCRCDEGSCQKCCPERPGYDEYWLDDDE